MVVQYNSRLSFLAAMVAVVAVGTSCESLIKLKRGLRGQDVAALQLDIQPAHGITIWLDGVQVASQSPYSEKELAPGAHTLEVKAPGYYPFTLPLMLRAGATIAVPMALRQAPRLAPAPLPTAPATEPLPRGVAPIDLVCSASPPTPVFIDGTPASGRAISLQHANGTLRAGELRLTYRITAPSQLDLIVPNEAATWQQNESLIVPGNSFRLRAGTNRITRAGADGSTQTLIVGR